MSTSAIKRGRQTPGREVLEQKSFCLANLAGWGFRYVEGQAASAFITVWSSEIVTHSDARDG